jgi:thymidylate synthase (FAD)
MNDTDNLLNVVAQSIMLPAGGLAPAEELYQSIEAAGRTCYQSRHTITKTSHVEFIEKIIKKGHLSVLEHGNLSICWETDRGVLAEITRHRVGIAYSVESTRYVTYDNPDMYRVIQPVDIDVDSPQNDIWIDAMLKARECYWDLLKAGASPQIARSVLPMSFATSIYMTANIREWRHILALRTSPAAHPQIRDIAGKTLKLFRERYPLLFSDI